MSSAPPISIVIPSHNRVKSLISVLERLRRQTFPASDFEVIVVADDCTDGTAEAVAAFEAPFRLTLVEKALRQAGRARNAGANCASADLLLFIDDDVLPAPDFVSAHVALHRDAPCQPAVVMGYSPAKLTFQRGFYAVALSNWWEDTFDCMANPGHRFQFSDVLSGNLSLPRKLFKSVGGFDEKLPTQEDHELGYRLVEAGAALYFSRGLLGEHVEPSDLKRSVARKYANGIADAQLWRRHPELRPTLRFMHARPRVPARIARFFAFRSSRGSRVFESAIVLGLEMTESLKLRAIWLRGCWLLFDSAYWRGVAAEAGSPKAFKAMVADQVEPPRQDDLEAPLDLDLKLGLPVAEALLNRVRPRSFTVRWGSIPIGSEPARLGAERLHAGHLRPMLATRFAFDLCLACGIQALGRIGLTPPWNGECAAPSSISSPASVDDSAPHRGFNSAIAE